jgi:hypothetical protein
MSIGAIATSIIAGLCVVALVAVRARLGALYSATKHRVRRSWQQATYVAPPRPTRWPVANATGYAALKVRQAQSRGVSSAEYRTRGSSRALPAPRRLRETVPRFISLFVRGR